jgi:hypothetical protein
VLKEFGVDKCETITYFGSRDAYSGKWRRKDPDIYVWGIHTEGLIDNKEYVWRIPRKIVLSGAYKNWRVDDEILVKTKHGENTVKITKIGQKDDYPCFEIPERVKEVVKNLCSYKSAVREYSSELADMLGY